MELQIPHCLLIFSVLVWLVTSYVSECWLVEDLINADWVRTGDERKTLESGERKPEVWRGWQGRQHGFSIGLCVRCVDYWACWQNNPWRDTDDNQRESILTGEITYWSANIHPPQGRVTSFLFAADYSEAASKFSATTHASDDPGLLRLGVRRVFTCYGNVGDIGCVLG